MATTTADNIQIIGGVDTHQDLHTAAIVSHDGTVLGTESFSTTRAGYRAMLRWFRSHGELLRVGVESTGTYGAGITRHLALSGIPVLEVTGPDPASRRAKGKDDALDAISAAEAARTRRRVRWPKTVPAAWKPCGCCERRERRQSSAAARPCSNSTTPSSPRRRKCVTKSATSPACDACVPVRPGGRTGRLSRPGGRDQALPEVPRPQNPRSQ